MKTPADQRNLARYIDRLSKKETSDARSHRNCKRRLCMDNFGEKRQVQRNITGGCI